MEIRKIVGYFCVFIGVLGLVLPIHPGIPFILLGIYLVDGKPNGKIRKFLEKKFPVFFKNKYLKKSEKGVLIWARKKKKSFRYLFK